jgi:glycosyltransferase involved in cell wall biosynthesis
VAEQLAELDIPLISLVHELPCSYSDSDYQLIYKVSDKIVFPVRSVRELTNKKYPIPFGKDEVIPQGLLNPEFGKSIQTSEARRRIRAELGLSADAFIVLGCGTLDMRKGIDHFAAIARQVGRSREGKHPIHFVWVGDGPKWPHSTYHYVQIDLRLNGSDHVHFVGEREHVDPYFVGADLFLLPSRVDPFPCVVHEAMAVQLPVLSFDSSGGAVEALAGGCGFVIPYADYVAAAGLIASLARDPQMADGQKAKALQRVQNLYRFERYADRIIDLAESVAGKRLRYNPAASPTAENRAA